MSFPQHYNNMASPFWDFVADLEERGYANGWFGGRRGGPNANRGMNRDAPAEANAWTQGHNAFGPVPHRFRGGPGRRHGPGHRRQQQEQAQASAVPAEESRVMIPESEKTVENEKTVLFDSDAIQASETEKSGDEKPARRGPGARRGGRGGKGMGPRARRAAAAAAAAAAEAEKTDASATEQSGDEKAGPKAGPRRGGRGGRGGRGLGRGNGQPMGPRRAARIAAMYEEMMAGPYGQFFMPMGHMGARRGGSGFGRGNGFGPRGGHHGFAGPNAFPAEFGFGPRMGPGAGRGGRGMGAGRGRGNGMGRGRGAAQANALPLRGGPGRFAHAHAHGPHAHAHAHRGHGPHAARAGPHHNPAQRAERQAQRAARQAARQAERAANPTGPGNNNGGRKHWRPLVDIYTTTSGWQIEASLPGAKKENVEVNFDSEKSVLIIKGEVHRDEEGESTLTKKERRVGAFQRRVKLGTKEQPASVDVEGISAVLVDGVLRVSVPKEMGGFVEVRKVDVN